MKTIKALLAAAIMAPWAALANDPPALGEEEVRAQAIEVAKRYAHAISCTEDESGIWEFMTLNPWQEYYARHEAEYAVVWSGDIGCLGGTGTTGVHLAIVKIGGGDSFYVDAWNSSPSKEFEFYSRSFEGVIANTHDVIVLEGREHGADDANCCPSQRVRYTLKRDADSNWKLHQRQEL